MEQMKMAKSGISLGPLIASSEGEFFTVLGDGAARKAYAVAAFQFNPQLIVLEARLGAGQGVEPFAVDILGAGKNVAMGASRAQGICTDLFEMSRLITLGSASRLAAMDRWVSGWRRAGSPVRRYSAWTLRTSSNSR